MSKPEPDTPAVKKSEIHVTVTFPLAQGKPFQCRFAADETAGLVRAKAMASFGVSDEPNSVYYLTHSGARIDDATLIGAIAGHAEAVKFTLVKELVQG